MSFVVMVFRWGATAEANLRHANLNDSVFITWLLPFSAVIANPNAKYNAKNTKICIVINSQLKNTETNSNESS